MKPIDILHEEQKLFFAKQKEYEEKHSKRDEDQQIIERAIMPHKGYNFSMSYDAFENAMERYANQKIPEGTITLTERVIKPLIKNITQ
jgi:hypothetical protein